MPPHELLSPNTAFSLAAQPTRVPSCFAFLPEVWGLGRSFEAKIEPTIKEKGNSLLYTSSSWSLTQGISHSLHAWCLWKDLFFRDLLWKKIMTIQTDRYSLVFSVFQNSWTMDLFGLCFLLVFLPSISLVWPCVSCHSISLMLCSAMIPLSLS